MYTHVHTYYLRQKYPYLSKSTMVFNDTLKSGVKTNSKDATNQAKCRLICSCGNTDFLEIRPGPSLSLL